MTNPGERPGGADARRRTTPKRLLAVLLATALLTAAGVAAVAGWPGGQSLAGWASGSDRTEPDPPAPTATPTPAPTSPPTPTQTPGPVREPPRPLADRPAIRPPQPPDDPAAPAGDFTGWAILDQRTGTITGSGNLAETSTTASMIKAWIVADYLRLTADGGDQPTPTRLEQLRVIIRDSHNGYTETVFQEIGAHASIERLIERCELTDSQAVPNRWSNTRLSPRDTVRMGACLADGRAAGPEWTDWLLDEMRAVRGIGDFGIRHAFPEDQRAGIAIKNGWIVRDAEGAWHVNCLAIGDGWTMGVLTRYPEHLGYTHGAEICRSLAAEHLPPP
ncbi:MAG: hypothetical protein GEV12_04715 [Micromonosporaceae bacterium]|nr:hypothetical protein [Micromonosporaceae bacterium]